MNKLGMKILSHTGIKQQFFRKNQKFSPKNKKNAETNFSDVSLESSNDETRSATFNIRRDLHIFG